MKYKLIIIWESGEKETHIYDTEAEADKVGQGFKMAFGDQVSWYGVIEFRG